VTIPVGTSVTATADVTITSSSTIDLQGALTAAPGVSITLVAAGDVRVRGTLTAGAGAAGKAGGGVSITSTAGAIVLEATAQVRGGDGGAGAALGDVTPRGGRRPCRHSPPRAPVPRPPGRDRRGRTKTFPSSAMQARNVTPRS
jgi:hypothetical protein